MKRDSPSQPKGETHMIRYRPYNHRHHSSRSVICTLIALLALFNLPGHAQTAPDSRWKSVEDAMGRPGQPQPGDVMRFAMPRKDLHVTLGDVAIKPGLALGSWAAFVRTEHGAMVMGDLVLTEDESGPVMRKLQEGGIEISAVHNHLIRESSHVVS